MKENSIERYGLSKQDFGKALTDSAENLVKQKRVENATSEVVRLMTGIDTVSARIDQDLRTIEIYQKRIAEIREGKFRIDSRQQFNGGFIYEDESLNDPR